MATGRLITDDDLFLFNQGTHLELYRKLGAHQLNIDGQTYVHFAVWAPNAKAVYVTGDFNDWSKDRNAMATRGNSGIWETLIPDVPKGARYKYFIISQHQDYRVDKTDPFAFHAETSPRTASIVWDLDYQWNDALWMATRWQRNAADAPISIYEMHLGSWLRFAEDDSKLPNYRDVAAPLVEYIHKMGFTHVEFMPLMEHPFYGSWGYQSTGYFAATSRYGTPQDLMYLIDYLHQNAIAVLFDWVPSHFTTDEHGLGYFDGTHLYEHSDYRQGWHPDWNSFLFNYDRTEVREFLINSALFWLDMFHVDGLRVDAVASMLYLDFSRKAGEWIPNEFGGRENLAAIRFLRELNATIYDRFPDVISIAEDSTSWPMVSRPLYVGGLGFGAKWDMGWMHDTLAYLQTDPLYRRFHQDQITFRAAYAFSENYVLALSHDEVVHGKASLLAKMPGDCWQKFANLRILLGYMWSQAGKKLLFMGGEFGQWSEWNHDRVLQWDLLDYPTHAGIQRWITDLNRCYREIPALHGGDWDHSGFQWVIDHDSEQSVLAYLRRHTEEDSEVLIVINFTPVPRYDYRVGVPRGGSWEEFLNSDSDIYAGSNVGNKGGVYADDNPSHQQPHSISLTLPPLAIVFLRAVERTTEVNST